ncbi:MAG: DedA family protein [Patescibacteria group bacterium]
MLELFSGYIIHLISATGYAGIFLLMAIESALIPVPSEITMTFAGYLVYQGELNFFLVVLAGAIGNLIGSLAIYWLGYYLEETVIITWIEKYGKYVLISKHEYLTSVAWIKKYGSGVAFFSRLLPGIRTFISLPAGLAEMNMFKFCIYTFIGSFIWSALLTYIGVYFGKEWNSLHSLFTKFEVGIVIVMILGVLWYLNHKLHFINLKKKS